MRTFTPADANKTLPLVKRIVADILAQGSVLRGLAKEPSATAVEDEVARVEGKLREHLNELQDIGCFYKDWGFDKGLVDFPARIEEREVFLCWRSDEEEVTWFHTIEGGFAGRKPIPAEWLEQRS